MRKKSDSINKGLMSNLQQRKRMTEIMADNNLSMNNLLDILSILFTILCLLFCILDQRAFVVSKDISRLISSLSFLFYGKTFKVLDF